MAAFFDAFPNISAGGVPGCFFFRSEVLCQDFLPSDIIAGIIIDLPSEQHPSIRSKAGQPSLIFQNMQKELSMIYMIEQALQSFL